MPRTPASRNLPSATTFPPCAWTSLAERLEYARYSSRFVTLKRFSAKTGPLIEYRSQNASSGKKPQRVKLRSEHAGSADQGDEPQPPVGCAARRCEHES